MWFYKYDEVEGINYHFLTKGDIYFYNFQSHGLINENIIFWEKGYLDCSFTCVCYGKWQLYSCYLTDVLMSTGNPIIHC